MMVLVRVLLMSSVVDCYVVDDAVPWLSGVVVFFFKQKTAYGVRISDWSSDVCSSDLLEPELSFDQQRDVAERLMAAFPAIMCYWYRFTHDGVRINCTSDEETLGGHFLALLHDKKPSDLHVKVMNVSLILYAEHEFNASTFTARVCASTLSDLYSCVTGAIGSLRGPLHGGANEAAMAMIGQWKRPEEDCEAERKNGV